MEEEKKKGITGAALKWIAVVSMFIDHVTAVYIPTWYVPVRRAAGITPVLPGSVRTLYWILRGVGRFAFPIYCFLLVEGFCHTRNVKKYLGRLFLFALVSEIPFDLAFDRLWFSWSSQNVFFTLFLGLLAVWAWDRWVRVGFAGRTPGQKALRILAGAAAAAGCMAAAHFAETDYGWLGVLVIFCMYFFRSREWLRAVSAGAALVAVGTVEAVSLPDFLLFHFYNGQRGRQNKYFFYIFYPAHLALLALARYLAVGL